MTEIHSSAPTEEQAVDFENEGKSRNQLPVDIATDARRVFEVLKTGGLAIIPSDVGYGLVATDTVALERAFITKQRKPHKRHAMIGNWGLHKEIHNLSGKQADMVDFLVKVKNLPLGIVAPYNPEHPLIQKLGLETLARSSIDSTLAILVNAGEFQDELTRLTSQAGLPLMGSSANLTGQGTKTIVEDIEPEILAAADIIIDYGKCKFSYPRASSTMIDFRKPALLRFGACYDVVRDVLKRFYEVDFPDDPGKNALFSGHFQDLRIAQTT